MRMNVHNDAPGGEMTLRLLHRNASLLRHVDRPALPAPTYNTAGMTAAQAPSDFINHLAADLVQGNQLIRIQQQMVGFSLHTLL